MANQAPQEHQQQHQQQPQAERQDPLAHLILEVQKERQRIKSMQEPTLSSLKAEVGGTNLDLLEDALKQVLGIRNHLLAVQSWASQEFQKFVDNDELQNERLDLLESFGGDTQIIPDHAQVLLDVIEGCAFVSQKLLQGPFPMDPLDEEGQNALKQLQEKCATAKTIVDASVLDMDSDDDDEDDDGDESPNIQMPSMSQGNN